MGGFVSQAATAACALPRLKIIPVSNPEPIHQVPLGFFGPDRVTCSAMETDSSTKNKGRWPRRNHPPQVLGRGKPSARRRRAFLRFAAPASAALRGGIEKDLAVCEAIVPRAARSARRYAESGCEGPSFVSECYAVNSSSGLCTVFV